VIVTIDPGATAAEKSAEFTTPPRAIAGCAGLGAPAACWSVKVRPAMVIVPLRALAV
jgi:hypothetical protein